METDALVPTSIGGRIWSVLSLVEWSARYLEEKGFESPRLTAELLLAHALNCRRIDLYRQFDKPLGEGERRAYRELFRRRLSHEPLQYIIGETEFMGFPITVDPRVLIPRPETEILVEQVIGFFGSTRGESIRILDIGTGSGNIAVSLAKLLQDATVDAIDVSRRALEVARINVDRNNVGGCVRLHHVDFLKPDRPILTSAYDAIAANPPYISRDEFLGLEPEVRDFEPPEATTDQRDGLTFFRAIAGTGMGILKPGGRIFVEVAYNQSAIVQEIFRTEEYGTVQAVRDYNGIERVIIAGVR